MKTSSYLCLKDKIIKDMTTLREVRQRIHQLRVNIENNVYELPTRWNRINNDVIIDRALTAVTMIENSIGDDNMELFEVAYDEETNGRLITILYW